MSIIRSLIVPTYFIPGSGLGMSSSAGAGVCAGATAPRAAAGGVDTRPAAPSRCGATDDAVWEACDAAPATVSATAKPTMPAISRRERVFMRAVYSGSWKVGELASDEVGKVRLKPDPTEKRPDLK